MKIEYYKEGETSSPFRVGAELLFKGQLWTVIKYIEQPSGEPNITLKSKSGLNDETITLTPSEFGAQEKSFYFERGRTMDNAVAKMDGVRKKLVVLQPHIKGSLEMLEASKDIPDGAKVVISEALGLSLLLSSYTSAIITTMNIVARDMKTTMDMLGFSIDEKMSNNPIGALVAELISEGTGDV